MPTNCGTNGDSKTDPMKKKNKKYLIALIIWLVTMVLANYLNEYLQTPPYVRGLTVGFWTAAAYLLFRDLMQPKWVNRNKKEEEEDE